MLRLSIIVILCNQLVAGFTTCSEILTYSSIHGLNAAGLDFRSFGINLVWIGCSGFCSASSFYCSESFGHWLEFGTTEDNAMRAVIGTSWPTWFYGCCSSNSNNNCMMNSPVTSSSATAICNVLGFTVGSVVASLYKTCPEAHWDGTQFTSDYVGSDGFGKVFRCSNPADPPTRDPTAPTVTPSVSPTVMPTSPPCQDKYGYCAVVSSQGMCRDENLETRIRIHNDCPVSCGTCFNSTISPSYLPSLSPTVSPTSPTMIPTRKPTRSPTHVPTAVPTVSPTCFDKIGYCGAIASFCNTSSEVTNSMMFSDCTSTCGFCSLKPTRTPTPAPTELCLDSYAYCVELVQYGFCHDEDLETRYHFQTECALSCDTCQSSVPSQEPSVYPTQIPTVAPTCVDNVGYCDIIKSYCTNLEQSTSSKMMKDCSATCGFCTLSPSLSPSLRPSEPPSFVPSISPSVEPTKTPTSLPTSIPTECLDSWVICNDLAGSGGCYEDDLVARNQIQNDCPSSCNTCFNNTVSPTKSPSFVPTGGPSEQPSIYPTHEPTLEPKCGDARAYCKLIINLCNSSDPEQKSFMRDQCAFTCGYCPLQPSSTSTNITAFNTTSTPAVTPEGEVGVRRREDVSGMTSSTAITNDYQNEMLFIFENRVWIEMLVSCSFVLACICGFRQCKVDKQKKGYFKKLGDEEMVYDVK